MRDLGWTPAFQAQRCAGGWAGKREEEHTFFFTVRGCSVARTTSSFCKAPPSMASTWTFGLLWGEHRKA